MTPSPTTHTADLLALLHFVRSPAALATTVVIVLVAATVPVALGELRDRTIPGGAVLSLLLLAVATGWGRSPGAVAASAAVGLALPVGVRSLTRGGLGWGDVKLCFAIHLVLGVEAGVLATGFAAAAALAVAAGHAFRGGSDGRGGSYESGIAFGPYLMAGGVLCALLEAMHG